MSKIKFSKYVASGNDFIIVDNRNKCIASDRAVKELAIALCRRRFSVGADGLLILEDSEKNDFKMRIINPDGSEVAMCGNGARCAGLYANSRKWVGDAFSFETDSGVISAWIENDLVKLKMTDPKNIVLEKDIGLGNTFCKVHVIDTGVPHAVHFLDDSHDFEKYPVNDVGSKIRYHKVFEPNGTNADFVKIAKDNSIVLRTYERGVEDETLACGTGATASAIISHMVFGLKSPVRVVTRSGESLNIYFKSAGHKISDVYLEGSARLVFEGEADVKV